MKNHFARKKVPKMRTTRVPARKLTRMRQSQGKETQSTINERLQTLGHMVVQEHLEAFKRLADE